MREERKFIAELEKSIKYGSEPMSNAVLGAFQKLLVESTNTYFQAYFEHDFGEINRLLQEQRSLRKTLTNELRSYADQSIVISAKLVQTYNVFNKLVQAEEQKREFADQIILIEKRYEKARKVLVYLYRHAHVQHKELKNNLGIAGSTLSDLLNVLRDADCVEKIESGRCCFYNLTNAGRKYLKDVRPDIDEEWDVDPDSFSVAAWKIIREKEQEETFPLYANYRRKTNLDGLDKKWTDEKNFMRMFSDVGECL